MIYQFKSTIDKNEINLIYKGQEGIAGICINNQVLIDLESKTLETDPIEVLTGEDSIEIEEKHSGLYFVPEVDTEEFLKTRQIKSEWLTAVGLDYVNLEDYIKSSTL